MNPDMTIQTRILHGLGDACLVIGELADELGLTTVQVSKAAALLIGRGYIERVDRGCFQLTEAGRAARDQGVTIESGVTGPTRALGKPRRTSIRQRAWNAMRITRTFTVPEIVTAVARAGDGNIEENLRRYVRELATAGYLSRGARRRPGTAPGSNGFPVYSLVRDTGPVAPVWSQKHRAIHDFNGRAA
jgi:DNA-binding MarR family transcriptional regulator